MAATTFFAGTNSSIPSTTKSSVNAVVMETARLSSTLLLKALNGILEEYEPTAEFDNDLFEQIVQDITVNDNTQITFRLLGDIQLTEKINEKGRCKSA